MDYLEKNWKRIVLSVAVAIFIIRHSILGYLAIIFFSLESVNIIADAIEELIEEMEE